MNKKVATHMIMKCSVCLWKDRYHFKHAKQATGLKILSLKELLFSYIHTILFIALITHFASTWLRLMIFGSDLLWPHTTYDHQGFLSMLILSTTVPIISSFYQNRPILILLIQLKKYIKSVLKEEKILLILNIPLINVLICSAVACIRGFSTTKAIGISCWFIFVAGAMAASAIDGWVNRIDSSSCGVT